jgi:hypothetical protein
VGDESEDTASEGESKDTSLAVGTTSALPRDRVPISLSLSLSVPDPQGFDSILLGTYTLDVSFGVVLLDEFVIPSQS